MARYKRGKVLYMAVTADELELPLVVCDSIWELARWADRSWHTVSEKMHSGGVDIINHCRYIEVILDDEETSPYARARLRKILRIFDFCKMCKISKPRAIMQAITKGGIIFYGKSNKKEKTDNGIEGASKGEE